jgi:shikimate kinase
MQKTNTEYIFSLGGGALQDEERISKIKEYAKLLFIKVPFDALYDRLIRRTTRPLLLDESGNLKSHEELYPFLNTLYEKRLPLYEMADLCFIQNPEIEKEENAQHLFSLLYSQK